ncbi:MAG: type II toxin-antitoxin system RelE/ParE family toxin [Alphaproteobacteria bacterium]
MTKAFCRFIEHEGIDEALLCEAIFRAEKGLIDADLGGGVIKQRVARKRQGKSGGYRTIIFFRRGITAFFVYGFAKSEQGNISWDELKSFRSLAQKMLALDDLALTRAMCNRTITEITCHG